MNLFNPMEVNISLGYYFRLVATDFSGKICRTKKSPAGAKLFSVKNAEYQVILDET